ncbi:Uncharacterised protein [Segatella copri]|nr:Uncharacterised protein [Segatella copri]
MVVSHTALTSYFGTWLLNTILWAFAAKTEHKTIKNILNLFIILQFGNKDTNIFLYFK